MKETTQTIHESKTDSHPFEVVLIANAAEFQRSLVASEAFQNAPIHASESLVH